MDGRWGTPWAPCQGKDGRAEGRENGGVVKGIGSPFLPRVVRTAILEQ